jgi:type VI secretion system protein ImpJ
MSPYFWGVCDLEIDNAVLKDHNFDLLKGEFLFKDGTWVALNHNAVLKPRSFKSLWERFHEPFTVYIALKRLNLQGEQVGKPINNEADSPKSRYGITDKEDKVADLYNQGPDVEITSLNYVLHLVWEKEVDFYPEYELIPIARIEYNGQSAVCSTDFVPAVVSINNSPTLLSYLRNIKEVLFARSQSLSGYKNLRQYGGLDNQPMALKFLLTLRTINHYIPILNHFYETPNLSPWVFYGVLRQLMGELTFLSDKVDVLGRTTSGEVLLPPYEHTNLGYCFKQVCMLIDEILDDLLSSMESVIHLVRDSSYYKAEIPVDLLRDSNNFYLSVKTNLEPDELLKHVIRTIKIGSQEEVSILIKRALSGVPLEHLTEPPLGLSAKRGVTYFRLDHRNMSWQSIKEYANLCVYWGEVSDSVEIDLVILKGRELLA